jgi:hypothetical protein
VDLRLGSTDSNPSGFIIFNDTVPNGTFELGSDPGRSIEYMVIVSDPENPKSSTSKELPEFPTFVKPPRKPVAKQCVFQVELVKLLSATRVAHLIQDNKHICPCLGSFGGYTKICEGCSLYVHCSRPRK